MGQSGGGAMKRYGDYIRYADFHEDECPLSDEVLNRLATQAIGVLDDPIFRYICSSWCNRLIWDYVMAHATVTYRCH